MCFELSEENVRCHSQFAGLAFVLVQALSMDLHLRTCVKLPFQAQAQGSTLLGSEAHFAKDKHLPNKPPAAPTEGLGPTRIDEEVEK